MKPEIKGIAHINKEVLNNYMYDAPEGDWVGRLEFRAWGKSKNLFLFFTDVRTQKKFRLSVFHTQNYRPYNSDTKFRYEPLGRLYKITTKKSAKGLPKFMSAEIMEEGASEFRFEFLKAM